MIRTILLCTSMLAFISCSQPQKETNNNTLNKQGNEQTSMVINADEGRKELIFSKDSLSISFNDHILGIGDSKEYLFEAQKGEKVHIVVSPEKYPANVRIKQIITPSGIMDGPFGNDMEYELNESGKWKFIIDESNMVGEEYNGDFTLNVSIKK